MFFSRESVLFRDLCAILAKKISPGNVKLTFSRPRPVEATSDPVMGFTLPYYSDLRETLSWNFPAWAVARCAPIPSAPVML
jgi:hypothetical protein